MELLLPNMSSMRCAYIVPEAWIIEEEIRRERKKREQERVPDRLPINLPVRENNPRPRHDKDRTETKRVIIIDI